MTQTVKKLRIAAAIALAALPLGAYAWTSHIDCEGGTLNAKTLEGGTAAFSSSFSKTTYSNEQVGTGSQSCKMGISQGSDGWGEWGGLYTFPSKLSNGSQLWIRLSVFVPSSFNYTANPWLKFMRVHTASPANSNQGYLDLYVNPPNGTVWDPYVSKDVAASFSFYYEGNPRVRTFGVRPTDSIQYGKWETYEIWYKLDPKSKDEGGTGEIRIWKNNNLLADLTNQTTLADAQTYAESFFLFTYWNGNAPSTEYLYVDDVIMTSDTPANKDSAGHPFIGGTTPKSAAAPMPPKLNSIQ